MPNHAEQLAQELNLSVKNVQGAIELIDQGNTIPFIARYRKEATGSMDDQVLRNLGDRLEYLRGLDKRKDEVTASITEQGAMTPELTAALTKAKTLAEVEDIYRPYKPKRKTRASIAKARGLQPLADAILKQDAAFDPEKAAADYRNDEVPDAAAALAGAQDIIAEAVSDDAACRAELRRYYRAFGRIASAKAKDEDSVYAQYYDFAEPLNKIPGHRVLALDRGEREGFLKVGIQVDAERAAGIVSWMFARKKTGGASAAVVDAAARDAYSRLITGVYVGLEGGQYALRLLLQNTFTDKVSFCHQHGIDIDPQDWPSHHLPTKIMTDRGSEFISGPLENLCESYHIEIENLPAYRPDLKGVVEKLFDLVQSTYKPLLKGKGVIESDTQERGAPDYRRQGTLDLEQFTAVVLRCVLFYNAKSVQTGFTRTPAMIESNTPPLAASIWSFCETQDDCPVHEATDKKLLYTLLPRAEGKITQRGLEIFGLRFSNCTFKKRFVSAGLGGRETVQVAYAPECMDTVWLYENGTYSAFDLAQKAYLGKSLAEIADAQQQEKIERTDWKKQELQAQLDLMSDIQAIADRSERTTPDHSNISKQIQRNRSTARKQESVSLMDLLTEQQEDDFDAR